MSRLLISAAFVMCWSSGFVGTSLVPASTSIFGLLAWRYIITAVLLLIASLTAAACRPRAVTLPTTAEFLRQTVLGVLGHVVFLGGVFGAAEAKLPSGTTALVCALQPIVVALVGRLVWSDHMRPSQWLGISVGIAAVAIAVGPSTFSASAMLLILPIASLCGLSGVALLERAWQPSSDVLVSLTIQVCAAAVCFTGAAAFTSSLIVSPTAELGLALCWLVLISGVGGYAAYVSCLRQLGTTVTSTLLLLTPSVTTLWAWGMFGQLPSTAHWAGLALSSLGVWLARPSRMPLRGTIANGSTSCCVVNNCQDGPRVMRAADP